MKSIKPGKLTIITLMVLTSVTVSWSQQTRYWVGAGPVDLPWESTANWSTSPGGPSGASIPAVGDNVIFDGANGFNASCTFYSTINLLSLTINGYSGLIAQDTGPLATLTAGTLTMNSGIFVGSNQAITLGSFSQTGGTFTTTSGTTMITGNAAFTAGTFIPNGGMIDFHINAAGTAITITGSPTLNNINFSSQHFTFLHTISNTLVANNVTIDLSQLGFVQLAIIGSLRAKGDLKWSGTLGTHQLTGGKIFAEKDILLNATTTSATHPTNAGTIEICGTLNQNLTSIVLFGQNRLPKVRINKPSGTLNMAGVITTTGPTWDYVAGGITPGTSSLFFYQPSGGALLTITGSHTLGNVNIVLDYNYNGLTVVGDIITNNLTLDASPGMKMLLTGSTLTVNGLLTVKGSTNFLVLKGGTIYAKGDINVTTTAPAPDLQNTSTIEINGSGNQNFTGPATLGQCFLPNITINKSSGTLTLFNKISMQGNWTYLQGTVDASTNLSTVFVSTKSTTIIPVVDGQGTGPTTPVMAFHHLQLNNDFPSSIKIGGALDVNGDLTVQALTTLDNSLSYDMNVGGNFLNGGTLTTNNAKLTFDGTVDQDFTPQPVGPPVPPVTVINILEINKPAGKVNLKTPLAIKANTGQLSLLSGTIVTTAAALTLNNLASTTIGNATSYVDGPLICVVTVTGARLINLPLGVGGVWRPAEFNVVHATGTSVSYKAEVINSSASALAYLPLPATIEHISNKRYLQISGSIPNANFTSGMLRMYFGSDDEVLYLPKLGIARANIAPPGPPAWIDITGGAKSGTGGPPFFTSGYITSGTFTPLGAPNNFSNRFALVNLYGPGADNPLPVELTSFTVSEKNGAAILNWETKSEKNNDYFSIQRSQDGLEYLELDKIAGAGTKTSNSYYQWTDKAPLTGRSYYRLKQVDYDDASTFSNIAVFNKDSKPGNQLEIYPVPVQNSIVYFNRIASVRIINNIGLTISILENVDQIDLSGLQSGLYYLIDDKGKCHRMPIAQ